MRGNTSDVREIVISAAQGHGQVFNEGKSRMFRMSKASFDQCLTPGDKAADMPCGKTNQYVVSRNDYWNCVHMFPRRVHCPSAVSKRIDEAPAARMFCKSTSQTQIVTEFNQHCVNDSDKSWALEKSPTTCRRAAVCAQSRSAGRGTASFRLLIVSSSGDET
jgi:hypothetical protein